MRGSMDGMRSRTMALVVMALGLTGAGCSGFGTADGGTPQRGAALVALTANGSHAADISRVTVTVSKGDGSDFTPIVADLAPKNGQWTGKIEGIPPGSGRKFEAVAYDATGKELYRGSAKSDIVAGATAMVSIVLSEPGTPVDDAFPVIDSLSASRISVPPRGNVGVAVTAHDPKGEALTYRWESTCGTFTDPAKATTTWTAPATATTCQLSVTVKSTRGSKVTASMTLAVQAASTGDAQVSVTINASPMISKFTGSVTLGPPMTGDLEVVAMDPDGDLLGYDWSSSCASLAFLTSPPYASNRPHLTNPVPSGSCVVTVTITDGRGGRTTGVLALPPNQAFGTCAGKPDGTPCDDQNLCTAGDACQAGTCGGTPKTCPSGQACDPADGVCKGGTVDRCTGVVCNALDQCHVAGVCDPATGSCSNPAKPDGTQCSDANACTTNDVCGAGVCVPGAAKACPATDACHLAGTCDPATGACSNPAAPSGAACSDSNACTQGDACNGSGACVAGTAVTCPANQVCDPATGSCVASGNLCTGVVCTPLDACHVAGVCNPATGTCSNPAAPSTTVCSDGNACTQGDHCDGNGACVGGPAIVCPGVDQCHTVAACVPATGCPAPVVTQGVSCNDGNACTSGETCQSNGTCGGGTPKTCTASDQCHDAGTCDAATGTCSNPASANGKACTDGLACTQTDTCQAGACVGGSPVACTAPATCVEPAGTCQSTGPANPVPQLSVQEGGALGLAPGFGYDAQGFVYQGGNMFQPGFDFGTGVVNSAGSSDVFIVKLDPASGRATTSTWAKSYGDAASDQSLQGLAVSAAQAGIIGQLQGTLDLGGGATLTNSGNFIDFVGAVSTTAGTGLWIKGVDLNDPAGTVGRLNAIASTPGQTRFAICGYVANKVATSIVNDPAAVAGGGLDIVVAVLDGATGTLVWGKQFGGAGDQYCAGVAFDDSGNVLITGQHKGTLAFTPLPALATPAGANSWAFVAKLNGTTGAPIASATFGSTGTTRATPRAIATDASGNAVITGQFQATLVFGATTLTGTGTTLDVFVAKLDGNLAPVWAQRLGGTAADDSRGVAVDSLGQVWVTGVFDGTATNTWGGPSLVTFGSNDAFLLRMDAATGVASYADHFGDALGQEGSTIVALRQLTGGEKDAVWMTGAFSGTITFPPLPVVTGSTTEVRKFVAKFR